MAKKYCFRYDAVFDSILIINDGNNFISTYLVAFGISEALSYIQRA